MATIDDVLSSVSALSSTIGTALSQRVKRDLSNVAAQSLALASSSLPTTDAAGVQRWTDSGPAWSLGSSKFSIPQAGMNYVSLADFLPINFNILTDDTVPYLRSMVQAAIALNRPMWIPFNANPYLMLTPYNGTDSTYGLEINAPAKGLAGRPVVLHSNGATLKVGDGVATLGVLSIKGGLYANGGPRPIPFVWVDGLTLDGNRDNRPNGTHGFRCDGYSYGIFTNLHIKGPNGYGIANQDGTFTNGFYNNIFIENTGNDGWDWKNDNSLLSTPVPNFGVVINNVVIDRWGMRGTDDDAALDIRGYGFNVNNVHIRMPAYAVDGLRLRQNSGTTGDGGLYCTVNNITIDMTRAVSGGNGISLAASRSALSNVRIYNGVFAGTGIQVGGSNNVLSNVEIWNVGKGMDLTGGTNILDNVKIMSSSAGSIGINFNGSPNNILKDLRIIGTSGVGGYATGIALTNTSTGNLFRDPVVTDNTVNWSIETGSRPMITYREPQIVSISADTSPGSANVGKLYRVTTGTGPVEITLPPSAVAGAYFDITKVDNSVGALTIRNSDASLNTRFYNQYGSVRMIDTGSAWVPMRQAAGRFELGTTIQNTSQTLSAATSFYAFNGTTATATLPAIASTPIGMTWIIKNRGSGTVTLSTTASANEIYNTSATNTYSLTAGSSVRIVSDGTYYNIT